MSFSGNISGSTGEQALEAFTKAMEKLSAKKLAPKATASGDDEFQFLRSSKRKASASSAPSASKKKTELLDQFSKSLCSLRWICPRCWLISPLRLFRTAHASFLRGISRNPSSPSKVTFSRYNILSPYFYGPVYWLMITAACLHAMAQIHHLGDMVNEQPSKKDV